MVRPVMKFARRLEKNAMPKRSRASTLMKKLQPHFWKLVILASHLCPREEIMLVRPFRLEEEVMTAVVCALEENQSVMEMLFTITLHYATALGVGCNTFWYT